MRSSFEFFVIVVVILLILGVVKLFPRAGAEFETAVRTYLLQSLQELKLLCVCWTVIENGLGLGELIGFREFLLLFRVFLELPQRLSGVFNLLWICIELLDGVLNEVVSFVILTTVFVWPLLWEERLFGLRRVISNRQGCFLRVVCHGLFVKRKRVRVVDWSRVAKCGIFGDRDCLLVGLQSS